MFDLRVALALMFGTHVVSAIVCAGVIAAIALWRPGLARTPLSVGGPAAAATLLALGTQVTLMLAGVAMAGLLPDLAKADRFFLLAMAMGGLGLLWSNALVYAVIGGLAAAFRPVRERATWLLPSAGVALVAIGALLVLQAALTYFVARI